MVTKLTILKDLSVQPHSSSGEAAARLDAAEAAVAEAYRRARRQGLVTGDGSRPERFVLTENGAQQVRVLSAEENPNAAPPATPEAKFSEFEERLNDTVEDVKGLFGLVDRVLREKRAPASEGDDRLDELQQENAELRSKVIEYYAVRLGQAERDGCTHILQERGKRLAGELEPETAKAVERLLSLEEELCNEEKRFWGPREEVVGKLREEISDVRAKLGFAAEPSEEQRKEESEKEE